jgi:indoleamine 2,3-dioxygenase
MPGGHRLFLEYMESIANIRDYVQRFSADDGITTAYNLAVSRLTSFRDIHIQIVARYIISPSRKPLQDLIHGINIATASTNKASKTGLSGTGGTELMPFLKQSRNETKGALLS